MTNTALPNPAATPAASNITKPNTPTTDTTAIVTGGTRKLGRRARKVEPIYYLFLLPTLVIFTLAITVPGVMGIFFSFTDSIGIGDWSFNGLTN